MKLYINLIKIITLANQLNYHTQKYINFIPNNYTHKSNLNNINTPLSNFNLQQQNPQLQAL